jgi:hypothetical protein
MTEMVKELHESVRQHIEKRNEHYATKANRSHKQVLTRINNHLDLPSEYNISATFNVSDLFHFDVGDDSRMNPFEERGNDENQQASLKDPLNVPVRPIT